MLTTAELKTQLEQSTWPAGIKRRAVKLLDQLGKHALAYLSVRLDSFGSEFTATSTVDRIERLIQVVAKTKAGDAAEFLKILREGTNDPDFNYGETILPFVLDHWELLSSSDQVGAELKEAIIRFFILNLEKLGLQEIETLFNTQLVELAKIGDLVPKLKLVAYLLNDDEWTKPLVDSIQESNEKLGSEEIVIKSEKVEPFIKNWISDFLVNFPKTSGAHTTFETIEYLNQTKNLTVLDPSQRRILAEIFKMYIWLANPGLTESEIREFGGSVTIREVTEVKQETPKKEETLMPKKPVYMPKLSKPTIVPTQAEKDLLEKQRMVSEAMKRGGVPVASVLNGEGGVNVQDIISRKNSRGGVSQRSTEGVNIDDLKKATKEKRQQMEDDINRKLNQLRTRNKN